MGYFLFSENRILYKDSFHNFALFLFIVSQHCGPCIFFYCSWKIKNINRIGLLGFGLIITLELVK